MRFLYEATHNFKGLFKGGVNCCFCLCELTTAQTTMHHWVCFGHSKAKKNKKAHKWFFDPLASKASFWEEHFPKLWGFIKKEGFDVNRHALEKNRAKVQSCGHHCIVRCVKRGLSNDEFAHWISSVMPGRSDFLVSLICWLGTRSVID
jgi:hypothetical protein